MEHENREPGIIPGLDLEPDDPIIERIKDLYASAKEVNRCAVAWVEDQTSHESSVRFNEAYTANSIKFAVAIDSILDTDRTDYDKADLITRIVLNLDSMRAGYLQEFVDDDAVTSMIDPRDDTDEVKAHFLDVFSEVFEKHEDNEQISAFIQQGYDYSLCYDFQAFYENYEQGQPEEIIVLESSPETSSGSFIDARISLGRIAIALSLDVSREYGLNLHVGVTRQRKS